jgi:hypothetical protein
MHGSMSIKNNLHTLDQLNRSIQSGVCLVAFIVQSVHLCAFISAAPTGWIFVKFYTTDFYENMSRNSSVKAGQ